MARSTCPGPTRNPAVRRVRAKCTMLVASLPPRGPAGISGSASITKFRNHVVPPPSYGGGAASYAAEGEGPKDNSRQFQIWNRQTLGLELSPSGPAGHLPRQTGEASETYVEARLTPAAGRRCRT